MWTLISEEVWVTDYTGRQIFNERLLQSIKDHDEATLMSFSPKIERDPGMKNKVDADGRTLLYYTINYNHLLATKCYIKRGYSMHTVDRFGKTPMHIALEKKDAAMLYMLAENISEVYIDEEIGRKWLRIILSDPECGKLIPVVLFPKMKIKSGGEIEFANILISEKCDLCYAISFENLALTKRLLDEGFSVDSKDAGGNTALHFAVRSGLIENVKLLLKRDANVNAQNEKGETPINHPKNIFATVHEQQILKLLVDHGSDWFLYDKKKRWQMYHVLRNGPKEAVQILLNSNPSFLAQDNKQKTVLHYLVKNRNPGVFELLTSRNIDVNIRDSYGRTPLHIAAAETNEIACKILLDKSADVNARSETNPSVPLLFVTYRMVSTDNIKLLELLLDHGANAQFFDWRGETVFDFLTDGKIVLEVVEILLGHFALIESLGTVIIQQIRDKIEANDSYKTHYDLCKNQLEKMKINPIYGDITFLKLLTDDERKVAGYMRNEDLLLKIKNFDSKYHINAYCNKHLNKRIDSAIELSE